MIARNWVQAGLFRLRKVGNARTIVTAAALFWICLPGEAIEKCLLNGSFTYTDQPCPEGAIASPFHPHASPPNDIQAAQQRYLSDLQQLRLIEQRQAAEQQQRASEAKVAAKYNQVLATRASRCYRLEAKKQSLLQQLSTLGKMARQKQLEQSRRQLRLAELEYQLQCQIDSSKAGGP